MLGCEPAVHVCFSRAEESSLSPNRIDISRFFGMMKGIIGKINDLSPYQQKVNEKRE
jgi:hypothetical protein